MPEFTQSASLSTAFEPAPQDPSPRLVGTVLFQLSLPVCGALAGWLFLTGIFLPRFGFSEMNRLVDVIRHLHEQRDEPPSDGAPYICALGSSIVQNGIDGQVVRDQLPVPAVVENLADPGAKLWDHLSKLPLVLESRPTAVLLGVGPNDYYDHVIANDKRYAMSVMGVVDAWPDEYAKELPNELSSRQLQVHALPNWRRWLHFRVIPMVWVNGRLRQRVRSNTFRKTTGEFIAPYVYQTAVTRKQMEGHLEDMRTAWTENAKEAHDNRAEFLQLAGYTRNAGATPIFLIYPIHPRLRDAAELILPKLREHAEAAVEKYQGFVIDASDLLGEEDYFDALHPSGSGRERWSKFVGDELARGMQFRQGDAN